MAKLDAEKIQAHCRGFSRSLCGVHLFETLPSTNTWLLQHCREFSTPQLCVAETQSAGRGRRGRSWQSPAQGVTFSLLRRFDLPGAQLTGLSLVTGCAVISVLEAMDVHGVTMKWPNDILHGDKKLCGLLIELRAFDDGKSNTITGVGLNYQSVGDPRTIDQPHTDLLQILDGGLPERGLLIGELSKAILEAYTRFEKHGFAAFRSQWESRDAYHGREVVLSQANGTRIDGISRGVADNGALKIHTKSGLREFISGEVSVRLAQ
jgi:BirA family biotin operon repressor/biotin-[acetyl-CoA-carboxylase] ligase